MSLRSKAAILIFSIIFMFAVPASAAYFMTPLSVRNPEVAHYHFRMQLIVEGNQVDFSQDAFQKGYAKDFCIDEIAAEPIHFHDNIDQFVHIHWKGTTGGQLLKYYGWNKIGGIPNTLGFRFDNGIKNIKIHGNNLPSIPEKSNFFIYIGDEHEYQQKPWQDFLKQDLEAFFGKSYSQKKNYFSLFFPQVYAHGVESKEDTEHETEDERLDKINTLIGNVVIFVQENEPKDEEIKDKFNNLVPLGESTCAG